MSEDIRELETERDKLRRHSVLLNEVCFKLAHALGDVPAGRDWVEADPLQLVERAVTEIERLRDNLGQVAGSTIGEAWEQLVAKNQRLSQRLDQFKELARRDRERANEAARLSAAARDETEFRGTLIDGLNEKLDVMDQNNTELIVENDRLSQRLANAEWERDLLARQRDAVIDAAEIAVIEGRWVSPKRIYELVLHDPADDSEGESEK